MVSNSAQLRKLRRTAKKSALKCADALEEAYERNNGCNDDANEALDEAEHVYFADRAAYEEGLRRGEYAEDNGKDKDDNAKDKDAPSSKSSRSKDDKDKENNRRPSASAKAISRSPQLRTNSQCSAGMVIHIQILPGSFMATALARARPELNGHAGEIAFVACMH